MIRKTRYLAIRTIADAVPAPMCKLIGSMLGEPAGRIHHPAAPESGLIHKCLAYVLSPGPWAHGVAVFIYEVKSPNRCQFGVDHLRHCFICTYRYMFTCIHIYISIHICTNKSMGIYIYIFIFSYLFIYLYVPVFIHRHI